MENITAEQPEVMARAIARVPSSPYCWGLTPQHILAPQRRSVSTSLPHIPNEIYLEIFDYLIPSEALSFEDYKATLSTLSLVCRFFRSVCLPRRLVFIDRKGSQKTHVDFCHAITKPPRLAVRLLDYVRYLGFSDWMPPSEESAWVTRTVLEKYTTVLGKFMLVRVSFSTTLHDISITNCTFGSYDSKRDRSFRKRPHVPWTRLIFSANRDYAPYLASIARLVASPHLVSFNGGEWDVAQALLSLPVGFQLKHLAVPFGSADTTFLSNVLSRIPTIEVLAFPSSIRISDFEPAPRLNIPADALPNLHALQCTWRYVEQLVTGRPVRCIDVTALCCHDFSVIPPTFFYNRNIGPSPDMLKALTHSTASIRYLTVPAVVFTQNSPIDHLAELEQLTLYCPWGFSRSFMRLLLMRDDKPVHPTVRSVTVYIHAFAPSDPYGAWIPVYDLIKERRLIRGFFAKAFPGATTIAFRKQIEWRKGALGSLWSSCGTT
ncbi:hypothetical protein EW146_g4512 [Bondarzewia mesenterica]|uniref:F-box domain-containing protein n=1 Tax=Bondarzewia mesenterica TaxID=1095465 RepID=A0A4S4LWH3_9AGAM|nr:hypothetical protein EW146_g4512 [Bondarzewia mesenterica]